MFYCFQSTVGSFLGFGSEPFLTRQMMNAVVSWFSVPDPEIEARSNCAADSFIS